MSEAPSVEAGADQGNRIGAVESLEINFQILKLMPAGAGMGCKNGKQRAETRIRKENECVEDAEIGGRL